MEGSWVEWGFMAGETVMLHYMLQELRASLQCFTVLMFACCCEAFIGHWLVLCPCELHATQLACFHCGTGMSRPHWSHGWLCLSISFWISTHQSLEVWAIVWSEANDDRRSNIYSRSGQSESLHCQPITGTHDGQLLFCLEKALRSRPWELARLDPGLKPWGSVSEGQQEWLLPLLALFRHSFSLANM